MSRSPSQAIPAIPLPILIERTLVGGVTALVVARPLVAGDDPGRLSLTAGGGPVSFSFCVLILLLASSVWRAFFVRRRDASWPIVPLFLAGVGIVAYISSRLDDRYARPGMFVAWEWIGLAALVYLTRRVTTSHADSRGLLNAVLATAVSVAGLGIYQALSEPLDLRSMDVALVESTTPLAGSDEFYPELNHPPGPKKATRGTFDSPETLLVFLLLVLPIALVFLRTGRRSKRGPWLVVMLAVLAGAIVASLVAKPFRSDAASWSVAIHLVERSAWFGVGPGNFARVAGVTGPTGAWFALTATIGLIGLACVSLATIVALKNAWPTTGDDPETPLPERPRWEFHLGGMAGLVVGFVWASGEIPAETPSREIFTLATAAVFRAVIWFATFALLEAIRPSCRAIGGAILLGASIAIVLGFFVNSPGQMTLLVPLFVLLAIAANLRTPPRPEGDHRSLRPLRGSMVFLAAVATIGMLITACLPAWSTASAVRQARMASRHFPERHREFERERPGPLKANALTASRNFLSSGIIAPLRDAAGRDPGNAALWLEVAHWRRPLWEYQLLADPADAARIADETRKEAELAAHLDPHNLAAKRSLFEAFLLYRKNSKTRQPERIVALNKLIGEIAEREPWDEVPMRFRMVRMLIERGDTEGLAAEVDTLLRLDSVADFPHGSLSPDQRAEVIAESKRLLKDPPKKQAK